MPTTRPTPIPQAVQADVCSLLVHLDNADLGDPKTGASSPFNSFWMGGFEGADHVNGHADALDLSSASGHFARLDEDYRRTAAAGLRTVRESIGWRLCEQAGGQIDLSRVERIAHFARRHGLQVLWTLMHYGLPSDLSLHDDALIARFARFAAEVARVLKPLSATAPVYTPVNEISFLAWMASQPQYLFAPNNTPPDQAEHAFLNGYLVKRRLVRAALAAVAAIREVDDRARFLHVEPLCHAVAPLDRPDLGEHAATVRSWQWQAWDMLSGKTEPELGGSPAALDLIGINHYHASQWEVTTEKHLSWHLRDRRRLPLGSLIEEAWLRYKQPLLIAETGHVGAGRADWLNEVAAEARRARDELGVPLLGLCLYPLVDRPDWNSPEQWHHSGLWHVDPGTLRRTAMPDYLQVLRAWRRAWPVAHGGPARPVLIARLPQAWDGLSRPARLALAVHARVHRVIAVEPARPGEPWIDRFARGPHLDILAPHGSADEAQTLVNTWLARQGIASYTAWIGDEEDHRSDPQFLPPARLGHGWADAEAWRLQGGLAPLRRLGMLQPDAAACSRLAQLAHTRPDWQIITVGVNEKPPDPLLERPANLHHLGAQPESLWPVLVGGWQVGITDTVTQHRDCLAAGLPVVRLQDSATLPDLVKACEQALAERCTLSARRERAYRARRLPSASSGSSTGRGSGKVT